MVEIKYGAGIRMINDNSLEIFISKILNFDDLVASAKIDYFVYFITIVKEEAVDSTKIKNCFSELKVTPYSNIPAYLKNNSKKGRGVKTKFVQQKGLYYLERTYKSELEAHIPSVPNIPATNDYFPMSLFENTRGYLIKIANQACKCYDYGLYDACAVMTRKLLEVLIIEAFERHGISLKIKTTTGHFLYLSDLIDSLLAETSWNIGRNAKAAIPNLKKMGDQSAHNRRYFVQESEIKKIKDDLRTVLEELIHLIDYPHWK